MNNFLLIKIEKRIVSNLGTMRFSLKEVSFPLIRRRNGSYIFE